MTSDPAQEADLWLLPLEEDMRAQGSSRAGMVEGFICSCYLRLVDWTSRLVRDGKASLDPQIISIIEVDLELAGRSARTTCRAAPS